ncbi:hypothetical protein D9M69_705220 [compost metagenome]
MLASLAQTYLLGSVAADVAGVAHAAQQVAAGDLAHASAALPDISRETLIESYNRAFELLLHILTAITLLSGIAVFGFLSRSGNAVGSGESVADVPAAQ